MKEKYPLAQSMFFSPFSDSIHEREQHSTQHKRHVQDHLPQQHTGFTLGWFLGDFHENLQKVDGGDGDDGADDL